MLDILSEVCQNVALQIKSAGVQTILSNNTSKHWIEIHLEQTLLWIGNPGSVERIPGLPDGGIDLKEDLDAGLHRKAHRMKQDCVNRQPSRWPMVGFLDRRKTSVLGFW